KKAGAGLWKKTRLSWGMECEEYFTEKNIEGCLKKAQVAVNQETILASRMILFKAMNEGILASKKPLEALEKCIDGFSQSYPKVTKKIAEEYPEFFIDSAIAKRCISNKKSLCAVKEK